jgi:hypothetical protein
VENSLQKIKDHSVECLQFAKFVQIQVEIFEYLGRECLWYSHLCKLQKPSMSSLGHSYDFGSLLNIVQVGW